MPRKATATKNRSQAQQAKPRLSRRPTVSKSRRAKASRGYQGGSAASTMRQMGQNVVGTLKSALPSSMGGQQAQEQKKAPSRRKPSVSAPARRGRARPAQVTARRRQVGGRTRSRKAA